MDHQEFCPGGETTALDPQLYKDPERKKDLRAIVEEFLGGACDPDVIV